MTVYAYDVDPNVPIAPPVNFASSPPMIILYDVLLILRNIVTLPLVFKPWPMPGVDVSIGGSLLQVVALVVSLVITVILLASLGLGVPAPWIALALAWIGLAGIKLVQGSTIIPPRGRNEKFAREAWFAVNGVCTSPSGLRLIITSLEATFHRPITGINNRTFGFLFDVIECLIQRDLFWPTTDLRTGYGQLCTALLDDSKKRVVLIAHSQGGILASRWMDQLLADFTPERLSKLEVYTFASAANHFSAPLTGNCEAPFSRVEHFANENDFVCRVGVLAFSNKPTMAALAAANPDTIPRVQARYAGRVFLRRHNTGHLLLSHYLKAGTSILADPFVVEHSRLVTYINGENPA